MLISKERAEYLAALSYKYCKSNNRIDEMITCKKAMEFDEITGEDIIKDLKAKINLIDMNSSLKDFESYSTYFADEILVIDNCRYVDSYEYDYNGLIPTSLKVNMHQGESFVLTNLAHKVYAEHIYSELLPNKDNGIAMLQGVREWELFLKLMIIEDRLINPYRIYQDLPGGNKFTYTFMPMKETLNWINGYRKEMDIINEILVKTNGELVKSYTSSHQYIMEIKPTVLYLETIGEDRLAQELRGFDELHLNYLLERAKARAYGLVAIKNNAHLVLL